MTRVTVKLRTRHLCQHNSENVKKKKKFTKDFYEIEIIKFSLLGSKFTHNSYLIFFFFILIRREFVSPTNELRKEMRRRFSQNQVHRDTILKPFLTTLFFFNVVIFIIKKKK